MTDKEKIRKEVEKLKSQLLRGACSSQIAMETRCKEEAYNEVLSILESLQEEPVSEDLGDYINELSKQFPEVSFAKLSRVAVRVAKWQKQQDQSTIELAEDHAMLAGIEKMKRQMIAKAAETTFNVSLPSSLYDKLWIKGCKEGDKLLVIKKDEL